MAVAVFGDFLQLANDALGGAAAGTGIGEHPSRRSVVAAVTEGRDLVLAMLRLTDDICGDPVEEGRSPVPYVWAQAAATAQAALRQAARNLFEVIDDLGGLQNPGAEDILARQLGQTAGFISAGRDLLQTHSATGADGAVVPLSSWSGAISSPQVTRALLSQIGDWCRQLSPVMADLSALRSRRCRMPHGARERLAMTYQCLLAADMAIWPAAQRKPVTGQDQRLLSAIPLHVTPGRVAPRERESVAELCDGITISAERLRAAARRLAGEAGWSPLVTADSWQWNASAAAITCDACGVALRTAAEGASKLGTGAGLAEQIYAAAVTIGEAHRHWLTAAQAWDDVTTDTQGRESPAIPDTADLLVRMGRLAFANPAWIPRPSHRSPPRSPSDLITDGSSLITIIAAAHHAADSLARVADSDVRAIFGAAGGGRLYQSTLSLPGWHTARLRLAPATPVAISALVGTYQATARAAGHAAAVLDSLALAADAPSAFLAAGRARREPEHYAVDLAFPGEPEMPAPSAREEPRQSFKPGPTEQQIMRLGISDKHIRQRAALIDQATAILRAEVEHAMQPRFASAAGELQPPADTRTVGPVPRR
jgi:hypothetical protein